MAESRTLDDLEEIIPEIVFWGGAAYLLYWTLQRLEDVGKFTADLRPQTFGFGEGGLIDRWTINPGEASRMAARGRKRIYRRITAPYRVVSRWF